MQNDQQYYNEHLVKPFLERIIVLNHVLYYFKMLKHSLRILDHTEYFQFI